MIDMAFAKKRVEDRKDWLRAFAKGTYVDYKVASMSYDTFINQVRRTSSLFAYLCLSMYVCVLCTV